MYNTAQLQRSSSDQTMCHAHVFVGCAEPNCWELGLAQQLLWRWAIQGTIMGQNMGQNIGNVWAIQGRTGALGDGGDGVAAGHVVACGPLQVKKVDAGLYVAHYICCACMGAGQ